MSNSRVLLLVGLLALGMTVAFWPPSKSPGGSSASPGAGATQPASRPSLQNIAYAQTGGLAGVNVQITVSEGRVTYSQGRGAQVKTGTLLPTQVNELITLFKEWDSLKAAYPPRGTIADGFQYRITYGAKTVVAADGAEIPEIFSKAQRRIVELAQQVTKSE